MARMTKMSRARSRLLIKSAFFGVLAMSIPLVARAGIPTACTDMRKIYYSEEFIDSLSDELVEFVVAHELLHVILLHGLRCGTRDHKTWNMACDYAVNWMLKEYGFTIWEHALINEKYTGMSAEKIYDLLVEDGGAAGGDGLGDDLMPPDVGSAEDAGDLERSIRHITVSAATQAKMAGQLPAGLERLLGELLNPRLPWPILLREYMVAAVRDNEDWTYRNRRFHQIYLPRRHQPSLGSLVVLGDTSGSVTDDDVQMIASEAKGISDQLNPEVMRVVWGDTHVAHVDEFFPGDDLVFHPAGGGGTDMRVLLDHAATYAPDVVILVTDGYTPWPDVPPDYPLIVCCTTEVDVPIGEVVRVVH